MSEATKIKWRIAGEEVGNCSCNWGCPCQFNAVPTNGHCESFVAWQIKDGFFGNTRLNGVRFARVYSWPGPLWEGNGVRRTIVDEQATKEQRDALIALDSGQHGGTYWEIFAAICPNLIEALFAPITYQCRSRETVCDYSDPGYRRIRYRAHQKPRHRGGTQGPHRVTQWFRIQGGRGG